MTPRETIILALKARRIHRPEEVCNAIQLALAQEGIGFVQEPQEEKR